MPKYKEISISFLVKHDETLLSWKSKKKNVVSRSSAEAEYRSMTNAVSEFVWIDALLKELGSEVEQPTVVYSDSKAALQIAANPVFYERTKHIEIDCHFIRQKYKQD